MKATRAVCVFAFIAAWVLGVSAADDVVGLRKRAEAGNAEAQYQLATRLGTGDGVSKDFTESVKWYRLAAEQGLVQAQCALATHYDIGRGVPRNEVESLAWWIVAGKSANADAVKNRDAAENRLERELTIKAQQRAKELLKTIKKPAAD